MIRRLIVCRQVRKGHRNCLGRHYRQTFFMSGNDTVRKSYLQYRYIKLLRGRFGWYLHAHHDVGDVVAAREAATTHIMACSIIITVLIFIIIIIIIIIITIIISESSSACLSLSVYQDHCRPHHCHCYRHHRVFWVSPRWMNTGCHLVVTWSHQCKTPTIDERYSQCGTNLLR